MLQAGPLIEGPIAELVRGSAVAVVGVIGLGARENDLREWAEAGVKGLLRQGADAELVGRATIAAGPGRQVTRKGDRLSPRHVGISAPRLKTVKPIGALVLAAMFAQMTAGVDVPA